jgi:UDP-N-acetylmuramyl pentapeptide phosphotransferase/UDP-N-acetylglucosamine-1-phosphate transferase
MGNPAASSANSTRNAECAVFPQYADTAGRGIAVVAATLIVAAAAIALAGTADLKIPIAVFGATLFIAAVGFADDVNSIPVLPRLLLQGLAVAVVVFAAPEHLRVGLDLMTVAEIVPIASAVVLLGWLGELPASTTLAAAALFGAILGFAPFNRPVAKIFLGDVGSLPIGLLIGWCLLQLAWYQQFAAALLLPLYYLADATVTLLRRIAQREPFWAAHRTQFYQRATMRRLHLHGRYNSNHLARLQKTYTNDQIDLIYVNSVASARMLEFLSFIDCPTICHVHELGGAIATIAVENMARLEERKPVYIAVSHAVKDSLVTNHRISADRIEVIHGFVPRPRNTTDSEIIRKMACKELGIPERAMLVCGCGSINFRKGTDIFLQVADRVVREYRAWPVHFVWVGGTPDKVEGMRKQVANSALRDVAHFVGGTSDAEAYFKASEVFVLTSREDPFPLVVMEAAQQGKPVVCFGDAGGLPSLWKPMRVS